MHSLPLFFLNDNWKILLTEPKSHNYKEQLQEQNKQDNPQKAKLKKKSQTSTKKKQAVELYLPFTREKDTNLTAVIF